MKLVSYLLVIVGILVLIVSLSVVKVQVIEFIPFLEGVNNFVLMGIGAVLVVVGILIGRKESGSKKVKELPIYHGKDVVGYRRTGK